MKNNIFLALFTVISLLAILIILTGKEELIDGLHLGDIGYASCIYFITYFTLRMLQKDNPSITFTLSLIFMLVLETVQLLGLGSDLQVSQNPFLEFMGKYIIGSKFSLLEIGIYIVTLILLNLFDRSLSKYSGSNFGQ